MKMSSVDSVRRVGTVGDGLQAVITLYQTKCHENPTKFVLKYCKQQKYYETERRVLSQLKGKEFIAQEIDPPEAVFALDCSVFSSSVHSAVYHYSASASVSSALMLQEHQQLQQLLLAQERAICLKFYEKGDMFTLLSTLHDSQAITESIAKYLFKQVLLAVQQLHSNQIAHRDIKPENFFVDEEFKIVLGDFGFSFMDAEQQLLQQSGALLCNDPCGTLAYMAPEVIAYSPRATSGPLCHTTTSAMTGALGSSPISVTSPAAASCGTPPVASTTATVAATASTAIGYDAVKADMWSIGCLLFLIVTGNMPFGDKGATTQDWYFLQIKKGKWESFWDMHESASTITPIPKGFKEMIQSLLSIDAQARPSAEQLFNEIDWLKDDLSFSEADYLEVMKNVNLVPFPELR